MKVSIELPVTTGHRCDVTERLLKATLIPEVHTHTHTSQNLVMCRAAVSGCDRELSAHFHSAASLWYQIPDNLPDTIPSHIILTAGRPVLALIRKSECKAGFEPGTSRSRSGHSIY